MSITKYRLLHPARPLAAGVYLILAFVYWMFNSGLFVNLFQFNASAPDIPTGTADRLQAALIRGAFKSMDTFIDLANFNTKVIPILIFALAVLFYREKTGLFVYRYPRGQSQKRVVLSSLFSHAALNAAAFYLAYLIYLTIGYSIIGPRMQLARGAFDFLTGSTQFSLQHVYLYYLLEGFFTTFLSAFFLTLMAGAIALVVRRSYACVLVSLAVYFGATLILFYVPEGTPQWLSMLNPTRIFGFMSFMYERPSAASLLFPLGGLVIPAAVAAGLTIYALKRKERVE